MFDKIVQTKVNRILVLSVIALFLLVGMVSATGLTKTTDTTTVAGYTIIKWIYSASPGTDTWTVPAGVTSVQYLVVAGGGGGGGARGGGGGAGGLLSGTTSVSDSISVTVGAGGATGVSGSNSSFGSTIISYGGGFGGTPAVSTGARGGSGGGAVSGLGVGAGTAGQGNNGGGSVTTTHFGAGGGGGASSAGTAGTTAGGGNGGAGTSSSITGTLLYYAGGGGGGVYQLPGGGGSGGSSVGGAASGASYTNGGNGVANTGSGGGGGYSNGGAGDSVGGSGSSGVIIISYVTPVAPTVTTSAVSSIAGTTATGNGAITAIGTSTPTIRGICYNTAGSPTTSDPKVQETGSFSAASFTESLTGLSKGTTYYARAFATSAVGTSYGSQVSFTTLNDPVASFTTNVTTGIFPVGVLFTDTSSNTPTSWNWSFGDGTVSASQSPSHLYTRGGNFTVNLTATNAAGSNSAYKYIIVWNTTTSTFSGTPTSGTVPLSVTFTDTSSNGTTYYWSFGDGNTSTIKSPAFIYNKTGTYNVNHSVSNGQYTSWTNQSGYITINPMVASSSGTPTSGNLLLTVTFLGNSTGSPNTYYWDFGDGNTTSSTVQNPTHVYTTSGTYSVNFSATNTSSGYTAWNNLSNYITVTNPYPITEFTVNGTSAAIYPMVVQFNDTSSNSPTTWNWSFGDGRWFNTTDSSQKNPVYTYNVAGDYTVNLTISNAFGSNTSSKSAYIQLSSDVDSHVASWIQFNGTPTTPFFDNMGLIWSLQGTPTINTNEYKFSDGSGDFTSAGSGIYRASYATLNLSTNDFTIEFWLYPTASPSVNGLVVGRTSLNSTYSNGWGFINTNGTDSGYKFYMGSEATGATDPVYIPENQWTHVSIERLSGTVYIYINGQLAVTKSGLNGNYDVFGADTEIGYIINSDLLKYYGLIDEFRISTGIARWTSNYTTPYMQYKGNLSQYPDINPGSTIRFKTDPAVPSNVYIYNNTGTTTYRTLQIQNITQTDYIVGSITTDPVYTTILGISANSSTYQDISIISSDINNIYGIIQFNITRPGGFSAPGSTRVSVIDWNQQYVNYSANNTQQTPYFTYGRLINSTTNSMYPVNYYISTNLTYGDWDFIANFTANKTVITKNQAITFDSSFTGAYPNRWYWDFGDGNTDNGGSNVSTIHEYTVIGNYTVTLTEGMWQNSSVYNKSKVYINVTDIPPVANFTSNVTSGLFPLGVQFTDNSTGGLVTSWNWSFGDGTIASAQNDTHVYTTGGNYTVNLTVTNGGGSSSILEYITVFNTTTSGFSASNTSGIVPVIANFTDTSNNATEWYWLFGDGNTSTVQSPVFTYTIPGSYSVNHSAGNGQYTSWTNKSNYITATQPAPVASFTSNISSGLFNLPVEFTDTSSNSPTSWNWSFGDGVTESIQNPTHVYTTGGNYTVNLTAINDGGSSSAYAYITVYNTTTSTFSGTPTSGIVPLSVTFTDTSSNGTTYYWDFGDGNTSTTKSLTFEYNLTGIYTVNHEVSNGYSTSWTNESNYIIVNQMVAQSSGTPTSGNLPLTVTFLGNSTGSPDTYYWDFGDGNTTSSTVQNPTHVYTTSGMYSVNFSATNASSGAAAWNNLSNYITVTTPPPVANFTSNVTTGLFPLSVGFTDTSSDIPTSWNWSFGDGTVSALQNPSHEFTTGGNYTVNLTATNDGGSSSAYRHVTVYNTTTSGFSANITSGTKPLTVQFTDTSSNATMWYWSFGDGNTSTVQSPEFIYNIPGIYNVNHSASNDYYTSWTNKSNYITVTTPPPVANFTSNVTTGLFPLSVGFTDTSSNTPASWNWSFGDGTVSALQNPSHEFTTGGNYTVNLTATNDGGSNSAYKYITVYNTTTSTFSGTPTSGTVPLSVTFTDTSSNGTTYYWSFGDGNTSTIKSPAFIYNKTGTYNVNHSVSNGQYTSWTNQSGYITINPMVASSSGTPTSGNLPLTVTFLGNSTGSPDTYYWDFGDGNTTSSTVQNPTHVYTTSGMYSVNFSATNTSSGTAAWNNLSEYITVTTPPPVANFTSNITSGLFPLSVGFTDTSSNTPTSWNWDFGDGIVSSLQNPSHIFTTGGNFTVNLTATNSGGSSSAYKYITAYNTTISGFTANITSGNNPLPIAFTVSTPNDNATAWNWSFGDGSYASTQNITHTYISSGIYTVIENASNAYTSNTTTKTGYITVHNATPSANFTGSPISGIIPLIVTFTDTSTVTGGLYWNWSYGDNSYDNFTTSINPSHIYNSIGNFTVSETITNDGGSDTQTRSSYISTAQPVPIANFTTNITSGVFPLSVGFTDTSSNTPISWNWSFGDGTISSVQNNTHVYTTGGNYTVNLTVTNTGGSSSAYAYIIVWNTTTSTFSGTPTSGIVPLSVTFTDTSSNGTAYYWVFGDGNTSTEKSPTFIYNTVGIYSVNHSVSNGQYTSWTNKSDYIINNPMTATATGTPTHGYPSLDVTFNGSATGSPDTYYWNFGDGDTTNNTLQKPVHTYISIGTYSVNFSATNTSSGAIAWNNLSNYITVSGAVPEVKFSAYPLAVYLSSPVQFTDSSTNNPTNWNWSFGNGIYSNEQNPNYTYPNSGMYTITLYVTNIYGSNYTSKINYINVTALPIPTASFTANHTTVIIGNPVQFTDTSSNTPTSWNWSFGDGIYSDTQNPYHIYTSIGTYSVSLTATNAYGSNTITKTNYITVNTNLPVVNFVGAPTVSILGTMVYFTDLSTNTPTSWNWSFGDGNYSTLENPGHIYPDYGVYSVTLTAVNGFGANTSTKSNYITVMIITPTATTIPTPTLAPPSPVSNQSVLITADVGEHYIQWGFASAEPSKKLPPMDIYVDDSSIPAARNYTSTTFLQTINISAAEKHNIAVYNSSAGITNQSEFLAKASVMTLAPTAEIYLFIAIGIIMLVAILILREFIWIVLISIFNIIMSLFGITIAQGHGAMPYVFIGIAIVSGILLLVYGVPKIREELDWF